MKRRLLVTSGSVGLAAAVISAPAIAQGLPTVNWRLTSSFTKTLDILFGAPGLIARRVALGTNGRFHIQVFAANEIVPGLKVLDAVQSGAIQCGHGPAYFYVGKDPTLAFDTAIPFGLNARQHNAWMYDGGGLALMREVFGNYNVINFPAGNTGAQMGGWFRREINSVSDLKGLKFRIPGIAGRIISRLGVTPQQIAPGDIYSALENGTIDAAEFVGPYDDERLGFYRVAPYYYYPGWWEGCGQGSLFVNLDAWNALPQEYQSILESACAEADVTVLAQYDARNMPALKRLIASGSKLRRFSNEILTACYEAAFEFYDETAATNPRFKKIYDAWKPFRKDVDMWFRVAENSFDSFVYREAAKTDSN